jgi:hypothetical protein
MKLRIYIEVEVAKTVAETIKRSGFLLEPDGSGMKMTVSNTPSIPKRKTHVRYVDDPLDSLAAAVDANALIGVNSTTNGEQ